MISEDSLQQDNSGSGTPYAWGSSGYAWGPNGHPTAIGSGYATSGSTAPAVSGWDTLHWDGSELLFTTNANGQVDDLKIGDLADITPANGAVFYDRGFGSSISYCHTATSVSGTGETYGSASSPCSASWAAQQLGYTSDGKPRQNGVGNGAILANQHGDGFSDGYNTIQGVRSYSDSAGVWTAPDAYSGRVDDPASQKSYMWNGNNAISYQDPTGYLNAGWDEYEYDFNDGPQCSLGTVHAGQDGSATSNAAAPAEPQEEGTEDEDEESGATFDPDREDVMSVANDPAVDFAGEIGNKFQEFVDELSMPAAQQEYFDQQIRGAVNALNNGLDATSINGAANEVRGVDTGFDHVTKVKNSLVRLNKSANNLLKYTQRSKMNFFARHAFGVKSDEIRAAASYYENILQQTGILP